MVVSSARPCVFIMLLKVSKAVWMVLTFFTCTVSSRHWASQAVTGMSQQRQGA